MRLHGFRNFQFEASQRHRLRLQGFEFYHRSMRLIQCAIKFFRLKASNEKFYLALDDREASWIVEETQGRQPLELILLMFNFRVEQNKLLDYS